MTTIRVSVSNNGTQGNNASSIPSISGDGRYIAYQSYASNLVSGDTNGLHDIFLYDTVLGATKRVSVSSNGIQSNSDSYSPSISGNGNIVAYWSDASNLVSGDTNGLYDVFLYDTVLGATKRVSVSSNGAQANAHSEYPSISGDGRYVVYQSEADNLVDGDTNGLHDVFLYDTVLGTTKRVSVSSNGTQGNSYSFSASISGDGRYVAYQSEADNLVDGDINRVSDVFVYDTVLGTTKRVSVSSNGTQANDQSYYPSISGDGRYVAYNSYADNLVGGDTNNVSDVFIYDSVTGATKRVSVSSNGTQANHQSYVSSISGDGRYVAYNSYADNLVSGDTNDVSDVFIYDSVTGVTNRISITIDATQANSPSGDFYGRGASISGDGRYVAYKSYASNLISGDSNTYSDIFVTNNLELSTDTIAFSSTNFSVEENRVALTPITITRSNPTNTSIAATVKLTQGTATKPLDYLVDSFTISFAPGETSKTLAIPIVNDGLVEGNETVNLSLINPTTETAIGNPQTAILTIVDNDTALGINQTGTSLSDTLTGTNGRDTISGSSGNDTINSGPDNDILYGNLGNDTLMGGLGKDYLNGGAGNDAFVFNSPLDTLDTIGDFSVEDDTILVSASGFGADLTLGAISSSQLAIDSVATTSSQRFIYNNSTGSLSFDVDGNGGTAQVQVATLGINLAMTNLDIVAI